MDISNLFKIVNVDNSDMSKMASKMFADAGKASHYLMIHQNDYKERALAVYEEFRENYIKNHRASMYFGRVSPMDLEDEAHEYALSKTISTLERFKETDNAIVEQHMKIVKQSPENFLKTMLEVLGSGNTLPQAQSPAASLPPEIIGKLLELHAMLEQRGMTNEPAPENRYE